MTKNGQRYYNMPGNMPLVKACTKVTDGFKTPSRNTSRIMRNV